MTKEVKSIEEVIQKTAEVCTSITKVAQALKDAGYIHRTEEKEELDKDKVLETIKSCRRPENGDAYLEFLYAEAICSRFKRPAVRLLERISKDLADACKAVMKYPRGEHLKPEIVDMLYKAIDNYDQSYAKENSFINSYMASDEDKLEELLLQKFIAHSHRVDSKCLVCKDLSHAIYARFKRPAVKEHKEIFCDLCGTPVEIYTSYEGTSCYVPKRPALKLPEKKNIECICTCEHCDGCECGAKKQEGFNQALAEVEALNKEE